MKKLTLVLFFLCLTSAVSAANLIYILDPQLASPTGQYLKNSFGDASGAVYVHVIKDDSLASGSQASVTVTFSPPLRSYQPQYYPVDLATSVGQLLSVVASLSFPCNIEIGSNEGAIYCGPATTTAATLQAQGKKLGEGQFWSFVATGPIDFGLVALASSTDNASGLVIILPQK